MHFSALYRLRS